MPRKKTYGGILNLGEERVEFLKDRLERGDTMLRLVRVIQHDWKELTEAAEVTVLRHLSKFKKDVIEQEVAKRLEAAGALSKAKSFAKKINVIEEMMDLVSIQKRRLAKVLEREEQSPLLLEQVSFEITRQMQLLEKLGKLMLDTGMIKKAQTSTTGVLMQNPNDPNMVMFRVTNEAKQAIDFFLKEDENVVVLGEEDYHEHPAQEEGTLQCL
jgi:hypothetical protein